MATVGRKVKHVVADSGAFIRNAPLRDIGVQVYTIPDVVAEIKDKATKQRLQFLPYQLEYKEPTPEAVKIVTEFSKKTGDYPSLSATDIKVLAVAYQLEKEYVGTKHIKTTPDTKIEINLSMATPSEPTQIAGFYLGKQNSSSSRTTSESVNSETSDSVDNVTSALEHHTITDPQSEEACLSSTSHICDSMDAMELQDSQELCEVSGTKTTPDHQKEEVCAWNHEHHSEMSSQSGQAWPALGAGTGIKIYSEMRDDSNTGGHVNKLTDEEEFPSLSRDSQAIDSDISVPQQIHEPSQIGGFCLGTQNSASSRTTSESVNSETSDNVDNVTSALEVSGTKTTPDHQKEEVCAWNHEHHSGMSSQSGQAWPALGAGTGIKIYSEMRDDSNTGGHVNKLTDEEEFPSLSHGSQAIDTDISVSQEVYVEVCDKSDDAEENNLLADKTDFLSLSSSKANSSAVQGWGVPKVENEVKDESGIEDSHIGEESDFPALSNTEYPSLSQNPIGQGLQIKSSDPSVIRDVKPFSYARIICEGQAKVQTAPAVKRVFHEGQVLPSSVIEDEEKEESEDENEEEIDEGIEERDDGEGWITPSNIKEVKKQMGLVDREKAEVIVGCLTMDFAMQNVLIQMGLNVISVDGMLITKAKSYVLRCFACFKITSKMEKLFCPHCGNHTLKRIAMTVNDDGTIKYFFSRRKQLSTRGLRQSLPTPKGGKHAHNPLLAADQPLPHQRPSRKALQSMDVFDPDFIASESPFSKHDITSRAAQLGIMRRGQGRGRKHQTGGKKNTGRRK